VQLYKKTRKNEHEEKKIFMWDKKRVTEKVYKQQVKMAE